MTNHSKLVTYTLLISMFSLFMCNADGIINNTAGFSIDIFHRDSPLSPTYNSSLSPDQHLSNAVQRSFERARLINNILTGSPYTFLLLAKSVYLASLQLGTPPVPILLFVDTGSNIIWTQCKGCDTCFRQASPYFDPQSSSTYQKLHCASATCESTPGTYCDRNQLKLCEYELKYGDGSFTQGQLGTDTVTFRSTDKNLESFPTIDFGCGYNNNGVFTGQESGVLGMGSGYGSLIRQLEPAIKGRFSYCLVSIRASKRSSRLNFGDNAIVSGPGTVSTRLFYLNKYFYAVQLDAVSINNVRPEYSNNTPTTSRIAYGNLIIDNGSTATYLNEYFYHSLVNALKNYLRLGTVADPGKLFDTCFYAELGDITLDITFHLRGADLNVRAPNIFVRRNSNIVCFTVLPTDGISIFGSLTQANLLIGFNLRLGRISFRRFNCEDYR